MESDLPEFHLIPGLLTNLARPPSLAELHGLLKTRRFTRSQPMMKMILHHNKFMELIGAFVGAG